MNYYRIIPYTGTAIDIDSVDFQETVIKGNNISNTTTSPNGKVFRMLFRGDEQKAFMIDDENKCYTINDNENAIMKFRYSDFSYLESGTETLNQTKCIFDTYVGSQTVNDDISTPISLTIYLQASTHTVYAIKTERSTSTETILIKEMRTSVNDSELECPRDYQEVDNDTFNQALFD